MADSTTRKRARFALRDLEAGKLQAVAGFLAHLSEQPEPVIEAEHRGEVQSLRATIQRLERELVAARAALAPAAPAAPVARADRPVRAVPKPLPRHVDRGLLDEFREQNPTCCVRHCGRDAHPHHLIERSDHGSDAHENLIPLCVHHHTGREGWHTLTPDVWVPKYNARLPRTAQIKIALAMETLAERRGDVIDAGAAS